MVIESKSKIVKAVMALIFMMVMCFGMAGKAFASDTGMQKLNAIESVQPRIPAPSMSSVQVTDLAVDENNEIHIEVKIMGTAKSVMCWCNGMQVSENVSECVYIESNRIVVGEYRYFHTGIYYTDEAVGKNITASVKAINAMSPWNTLTASNSFTVPPINYN